VHLIVGHQRVNAHHPDRVIAARQGSAERERFRHGLEPDPLEADSGPE
jgi:hypothetical protein